MFRKTWMSFACSGFLAVMWVLTGGASPARAEEARPATLRTITVVGEGSVSVRPDVAKANIGVAVTAPTVKEAVSQNRAGMVAVLSALKRAGVAEKDILTTNYSIYYEPPQPKEQGRKGGAETKGRYHVNNMALVTIRDMEKVDAALDAATGAGANQVWGVNFVVDNTDSVSAQARGLAVAQARTKAEALARAGGVRLGPVISISEDAGGRPVPMMRMMAMKEAGDASSISAGEMTFSAQVQMIFGIE